MIENKPEKENRRMERGGEKERERGRAKERRQPNVMPMRNATLKYCQARKEMKKLLYEENAKFPFDYEKRIKKRKSWTRPFFLFPSVFIVCSMRRHRVRPFPTQLSQYLQRPLSLCTTRKTIMCPRRYCGVSRDVRASPTTSCMHANSS